MNKSVLAVLGVVAMASAACSASVESTGSSASAVVGHLHDWCTNQVIADRYANGEIVFVDGHTRRPSDIVTVDKATMLAQMPVCVAPAPTGDLHPAMDYHISAGGCYFWHESETTASGTTLSWTGSDCGGVVTSEFTSTTP